MEALSIPCTSSAPHPEVDSAVYVEPAYTGGELSTRFIAGASHPSSNPRRARKRASSFVSAAPWEPAPTPTTGVGAWVSCNIW